MPTFPQTNTRASVIRNEGKEGHTLRAFVTNSFPRNGTKTITMARNVPRMTHSTATIDAIRTVVHTVSMNTGVLKRRSQVASMFSYLDSVVGSMRHEAAWV
jgi:hypothetical protein